MLYFTPKNRGLTKVVHISFIALVAMLLLLLALLGVQTNTPTAHAAPIPPPDGYPKLNLSMKTVTPTLINVGGGVLTYQIHIQNTGAYTAEGVTLYDFLPDGTTYNGVALGTLNFTPILSDGVLYWEGDVGFDDTVVIEFSVTLSPTLTGLVTNTAVLSQAYISQPITVSAVTIVTDNPIFRISKTSTPNRPGPNLPLHYSIIVSNHGQPTVNLPITVTDVVPLDTTISDIGQGGVSDGDVVTWTDTVSLDFGESMAFTFSVMVDDVISGTIISNDTYQISDESAVLAVGNPYTVTAVGPILSLFKEIVPDPPGSNQDASYILTLFNSGSLATNLVITDQIPAGAIYMDGGSLQLDTLSWSWPDLDTGESTQFTYTFSISDIAQFPLVNSNYGVCTDEGVCQAGQVLTSVVRPPSFDVTAALNPIAKKPGGGGGPVTPTLTARNVGPGNALDAVAYLEFYRISISAGDIVVDPPIGTLSSGFSCGDKCTAFTWVGDMAVGDVITFTTPQGQSTIGGTEGLHYTATIVMTDSLSAISTQPVTASAAGIVTHLANLVATKSGPKIIGRGQVMTYSINVLNTGLSTDTPPDPWLWDYVPDNTTVITSSISNGGELLTIMDGTLQMNVISWTLPALGTGQGTNRSFSVVVDNNLISGTEILNTYEVFWYNSAASGDGILSNIGVPVTTTVKEVGLIDSYKTVTPKLSLPGPGNILNYEIHIVNSSEVDLTDVVVDDLLPWREATYQRDAVASSGQVISDIVSLSWVGDVAAFSEETVTFSMLVDADFEGVITNTAVVTHPDLLNPVDITAVAYVTDDPLLRISKFATPNPVEAGSDLLYTIQVTNLGQQASNLVITDVLPSNTRYVAESATGGGLLMGDELRWNVPVLESGESRIFRFEVTALGGFEVINAHYGVTSAEGVGAMGEPVVTNIVFAGDADLAITKERIGTGDAFMGGVITYSLTLSNAGPTSPLTVTVMDTFSPTDAIVSVSSTGGSCGSLLNGAITCTVTNVADAPASTLALVAVISNTFTGTIGNIARVAPPINVFDPDTSNNVAGPVLVNVIRPITVSGLTAYNDSPTPVGWTTVLSAMVATGTDVSYSWDFGDGTTGVGPVVPHLYPAIGTYTAIVTASNGLGFETASTVVTITDAPIPAVIAFNDSPTQLGQITNLSATTVGTGTTLFPGGSNVVYTWDLGDGTTGTGPSLTHIYPAAGNYTAIVTASNSVSLVSASTLVTITEGPIVGLVAINDSPTQVGNSTTLTASVISGTNVSYTWDLGDGTTASGAVVAHTYLAIGSYTAVVTASNSVNQLSTTTLVTITEAAIAGLTAINDSPTILGNVTTLTASVSSGDNVVYTWDLGDGNTGTGAVIAHTYAAAGTYTAVVTASNSVGSVSASTSVTIIDASITGLTAINDSPTILGNSTTLTASVSNSGNVVYTWDLGDGNTGAGAVVAHTYAAVGTYTAIVTASNATSSDSTSTQVTITDEPITGLVASNDGPTEVGANTTLSASIATGSNVSYTWDYGDGTTGTGAVSTHVYPAVGTYTAIVTATNSVGSVSASTDVIIIEVSIAGLTASNDSPTFIGNVTSLSATVTAGTNISYTWDLGDGTTATGMDVVHTYPAVGTYTAVVTATNDTNTLTSSTIVTIESVITYLPIVLR